MAGISRRGFLALFSAAAAGLVVGDYDPSKLEWFAPASMPKLTTLPDAIPLLPREAAVRDLVERSVAPQLSLRSLVRDVMRETHRRMGAPRLELLTDLPGGHLPRMGDTVRVPEPVDLVLHGEAIDWDAPITREYRPVTITDQFTVEFALTPHVTREMRDDEVHVALVQPASAQLARYLTHHRVRYFTDLVLPPYAGFGAFDEGVVVVDRELGMAMRALRSWDWARACHVTRLDVLGGRA